MNEYGFCLDHINDTGDQCPTCEINALRTRIAELEAAICGWYEWAGNDDLSDRPLDRLNDIAKALLDGRGE